MSFKKGTGYSARLKYLLVFSVIGALMCISTHVFAQAGPPGGPPPPPPPPDEVFKKINPFKKHKKDTANKKVDTSKNNTQVSRPAGGPPPPPNPLNLFKKKKKDTTAKSNSN